MENALKATRHESRGISKAIRILTHNNFFYIIEIGEIAGDFSDYQLLQ